MYCVMCVHVSVAVQIMCQIRSTGRPVCVSVWLRWGWSAEVCHVTGGATAARRDSLEFGAGPAAALQEYAARKWGPSPLSPPLGALGPVGLRPVSAAPGAETAKYRCSHTRHTLGAYTPCVAFLK